MPALAFLDEIIITPLAPRTPKIANEEGSFNTSIDSISLGLIKLILSVNIPSTTYNGFVLYLLTVPLILTSGSAPGCPEFTTDKPETLPCKDATGLVFGLSATIFPSTLTIEPVKSRFLAVPYPMTTTSFNSVSLDSCIFTAIVSEVALTETASKPTMDIFNTSPTLALILKFPSKSVSAVVLESAATIIAPGIPTPLLSDTFPLIT